MDWFRSFCVNSVNAESGFALTQLIENKVPPQLSHHGMITISKISANSRIKSRPLQSLILWPIQVWSMQKTRTSISLASAGRLKPCCCVSFTLQRRALNFWCTHIGISFHPDIQDTIFHICMSSEIKPYSLLYSRIPLFLHFGSSSWIDSCTVGS